MGEKNYKSTLWAIFIIFLILSTTGIIFIGVWTPMGEGGEGITIAVLDSGINLDIDISGIKVSRELKDKIVASESFITTEHGYTQNATIKDNTEVFHGTRVALEIGGRSLGEAPEAKLVIARCANDSGVATPAAIIAAFQWAITEGEADIVNLSIGGNFLYNNSIVDLINQATFTHGVLTVISAGNRGDTERLALSTIESPGDALQAITVGAIENQQIASYSSLGPLKDHRIKPDLVASGYAFGAQGTSFAAPRIAGRAAILMSWCLDEGYVVTPGLLKAAMMKTASNENDIPVHYGGAGITSMNAAQKLISSARKIDNIPLVTHVSPSSLPFGLNKMFQEDIWNFPLTVISSIEQELTISTITSRPSILSFPFTITVNQSSIVPCNFIIPEDFSTGTHQEQIELENIFGDYLIINVSLTIEEPQLKVAIDTYHSLWDMDNLLGQFNELRIQLADLDVSCVELTHPSNFSTINNYDVVILPDPNSYGARLDSDYLYETFYQEFHPEIISSYINYVSSGGGLMVLGIGDKSSAINESNKLVSAFNITFTSQFYPPIQIVSENGVNVQEITNLTTSHPIMSDISSFDFYGCSLNITGNNTEVLAWASINQKNGEEIITTWQPLVAIYENTASNGRVLVFGSNYMFDNYGLTGNYNSMENDDLLLNAIAWLAESTL
ncbi:hypothetical protein EU523_00585 [Candidatus Heimdallarchaeota archaeon]|jgi:uncharacterized membrane protein|nr:MAG: hypothetical protein EU523_00585 [Candidatus Heimdallarchaeota archaeon]